MGSSPALEDDDDDRDDEDPPHENEEDRDDRDDDDRDDDDRDDDREELNECPPPGRASAAPAAVVDARTRNARRFMPQPGRRPVR